MSKAAAAQQHWLESHRASKLERLLAQATDYSFPASQATAGLQLATVEVPRLLREIELLKEQINGSCQDSAQGLELLA